MGKNEMPKVQQDQTVIELICGMETMDGNEFEDLYNELDVDHQMEVDRAMQEFADGAVGEHWDSDERGG